MDQAGNLRSLLDLHKKNSRPLPPAARVITVTSGKGGVGKTNFTVNLALYLHRKGVRVVVLDADLGLANIEILLGIAPKHSLLDVLAGKNTLEEIITHTHGGMGFISGGSGLVEMANISEEMLKITVQKLGALDEIADIILIDTGAGISNSVLKFVTAASECVVVCTPEPTSITDAYSLIKAVKDRGEKEPIPQLKIVINGAEDKDEGRNIFKNLQQVAQKFLSMELTHLGTLPHDANLRKAVRSQKPCVLSYPNTAFSREIENIGNKILDIQVEKPRGGMKGFMKRLTKIFGN
ncbi:MAG: MinD/ParA family protein [Clostridiales bacterium]|jgi:flagellar biosynthesis protein FlhG|nr:MinD/ParA family protein [Clostridiales bacterium]